MNNNGTLSANYEFKSTISSTVATDNEPTP
jgi:hypothetical protein